MDPHAIEICDPGSPNGSLSPLQEEGARIVARWIVESGVTPSELCAWKQCAEGRETSREELDLLMDTCSLAHEATGATSYCTLAQIARVVVATASEAAYDELTELRKRVAELESLLDLKAVAE